VGRGLERGGGQRAAEVGLVEPDDAKAGGGRVVAQPPERQLVAHGEEDQGVRGAVPVAGEPGVGDREVECRVRRLARLRPRRQVVAGDQVEAGW